MSDNTLTELMDEFGVRVEMSDGEDDTVSQVLMDMLTEIHRLRNQAAERTPMPSDLELAKQAWEAAEYTGDSIGRAHWVDLFPHFQWQMIGFTRAVREAITAAQPLTVPEYPDWANSVSISRLDNGEFSAVVEHYYAQMQEDRSQCGHGSTWQEALASAIAATGEGE